jgi:hypothetical protein
LARWNSSTSTTRPYLKELRNRDPGDAVTDAATALQKNKGLLKGNDTPLTDAVCKTVDWVAAKRNQGEAHKGDPDINMSDAWMVVRSAV